MSSFWQDNTHDASSTAGASCTHLTPPPRSQLPLVAPPGPPRSPGTLLALQLWPGPTPPHWPWHRSRLPCCQPAGGGLLPHGERLPDSRPSPPSPKGRAKTSWPHPTRLHRPSVQHAKQPRSQPQPRSKCAASPNFNFNSVDCSASSLQPHFDRCACPPRLHIRRCLAECPIACSSAAPERTCQTHHLTVLDT